MISPDASLSAVKGRMDSAPVQGANRSVDAVTEGVALASICRRIQRWKMLISVFGPYTSHPVNPPPCPLFSGIHEIAPCNNL